MEKFPKPEKAILETVSSFYVLNPPVLFKNWNLLCGEQTSSLMVKYITRQSMFEEPSKGSKVTMYLPA